MVLAFEVAHFFWDWKRTSDGDNFRPEFRFGSSSQCISHTTEHPHCSTNIGRLSENGSAGSSLFTEKKCQSKNSFRFAWNNLILFNQIRSSSSHRILSHYVSIVELSTSSRALFLLSPSFPSVSWTPTTDPWTSCRDTLHRLLQLSPKKMIWTAIVDQDSPGLNQGMSSVQGIELEDSRERNLCIHQQSAKAYCDTASSLLSLWS